MKKSLLLIFLSLTLSSLHGMKREREDGDDGRDSKRQKIEELFPDPDLITILPKEVALKIVLQLVGQEWGGTGLAHDIATKILAIIDSNEQFANVFLDFNNFQFVDFQGIDAIEIEQFETDYNNNKKFLITMIHRLGQLVLELTGGDKIFSFYYVYHLIDKIFDYYGFSLVDLYEGSQEMIFDNWADLFGFANVDDVDLHGSTLLAFAIDFNDIVLVNFLVSVGVDVNFVDNNNQSHLMVAVRNGSLAIAKMLIDSGVDVNFEDENGFSVLMFAVQQNNQALVNLLLDGGAYIHYADNDGDTALSVAVYYGFIDLAAHLLLKRGADVNDVSVEGQTILMIAVEKNNLSMTQLLIKYEEIDINVVDNDGNSALMYALMLDEPITEIIELLLQNGAEVAMQNGEGDSPLIIASHLGNYGVVELLLQSGADVNLQNDEGQTALFMSSDDRIAQLLINYGADVNIKDNSDVTSIEHFVAIRNDIGIVQLLLATNKLNLNDVRNAREFEMTAEIAELLDEYIAQQEQMDVE